jgi:hypothetical protein
MGDSDVLLDVQSASRRRHHIQICKTLSCKIMGEPDITEHVCSKLGIHPGETTEDGKFTVTMVECLGSCGTAPMMQIGFDYHEDLTPTKSIRSSRLCKIGGIRAIGCEPLSFKAIGVKDGHTLKVYQKRGLRVSRKGAVDDSRSDHSRGQGLSTSRPRRCRLPDRDECGPSFQRLAKAKIVVCNADEI